MNNFVLCTTHFSLKLVPSYSLKKQGIWLFWAKQGQQGENPVKGVFLVNWKEASTSLFLFVCMLITSSALNQRRARSFSTSGITCSALLKHSDNLLLGPCSIICEFCFTALKMNVFICCNYVPFHKYERKRSCYEGGAAF